MFHFGTFLAQYSKTLVMMPHAGLGRIDVRAACDVLLQQVVLNRAADRAGRNALFLGDQLVEQQQDRRGRVDRHARADLIEWQAAEQDPHVGDAVDGYADSTDLALCPLMVAVVTHLGGQIERTTQPGLAGVEQELEPLVGRCRGAKAGVLPHSPQLAAVHRRVDAAGIGRGTGSTQLCRRIPTGEIRWRRRAPSPGCPNLWTLLHSSSASVRSPPMNSTSAMRSVARLRSWPAVEMALRYLVMAAVLASGVIGVVTHRNLYQDGSNFLWQSIDSRWFFTAGRPVSQIVVQIPLVVALKLGVTSLSALSFIHGISVIMLHFGVWAMAMYVLRRHAMFWSLVVVFAATFLNQAFFSIGEFNFAAAFIALSFSLLLRSEHSRRSTLVLVACASMLPFSYEVLVFAGPLLAAMAVARIRTLQARETVDRFVVRGLWFSFGLYCVATLASLYYIVFPFDPRNRGGAANFMEAFKTIPQLNISLVVGGLFLLVNLTDRRSQIAKIIVLTGLSLVLLRPSLWSEGWQNFQGRSVSVTMMVVFMAVIAIRSHMQERPASQARQAPQPIRAAFLPAVVLLLVQVVPLTVHSVGFSRWVHSFAEFVNSHHGVVDNQSMALEVPDTYSYVSAYASPFLSALVADNGDGAIVLAPGQAVTPDTSWMPQHFHFPAHMYVGGSVLARL